MTLKILLLLILIIIIGLTGPVLSMILDRKVSEKIAINIVTTICCLGLILLLSNTIHSDSTHTTTKTESLVSNPTFIAAGNERKYDKDNEEHWGDCLSQTPKDGWVFVPWGFQYSGLEEGETYNITITIGKVYESDNGDSLYEGENIDAITASFTPSTSEGEVAYKFYYNPKYVNDGKYKIFADIDN